MKRLSRQSDTPPLRSRGAFSPSRICSGEVGMGGGAVSCEEVRCVLDWLLGAAN